MTIGRCSRRAIAGGLALVASITAAGFAGCKTRTFNNSASTKPASANSAEARSRPKTVVQMFNWPFREMLPHLASLGRMGYTHVLISPHTLSHPNPAWWGRYQPIDYRVVAGPLGTDEEFRSLVRAARNEGLEIVADLVLNHTAGMRESADLTYPHPEARKQYGVTPLFTAEDFHEEFCIRNYSDTHEVRNGRICGAPPDKGLPDLNQGESPAAPNVRVLKAQRAFISSLIEGGVRSFRLDAMKHMEPWYFKALFEGFEDKIDLLFGEIIFDEGSWDADYAPYLKESTSKMRFYDFPLVVTLKRALGMGGDLRELLSPEDYRKSVGPARSVAFVMNHDIPANPMEHFFIGPHTPYHGDPKDEALAYAYVISRGDLISYVYSDRGTFDPSVKSDAYANAHCRSEIQSLLSFRTRNAARATAVKEISQAGIDPKNAIAIVRGTSAMVVINKSGESIQLGKETLRGLAPELQASEAVVKGRSFLILDNASASPVPSACPN